MFSLLLLEAGLRLMLEPAPEWIEPQVGHDRSPLLGWVLPVGLRGAYTIDAPVSTNSLGLREDEIPLQKPQGERRVLSLGDSFTFALGVRFEDLYVQKLERMLRARWPGESIQVINAGVAGYNSRQELLYLLAQGLEFEPDLITVGFYWNDLRHNEEPLPDLDATPIRAEKAEERGSSQHTIPHWLRSKLRKSLLLYTAVTRTKTYLQNWHPPEPGSARWVQDALLEGRMDDLAPYWSETAKRLRAIAEVGRTHDIPVILIAFPMENQLYFDLPRAAYSGKLEEIWSDTGYPFIDLVPLYEEALAKGRNPFLPYDLHPSEHGMQIAAQAILDVIVDRSLLENPPSTGDRQDAGLGR